MLQVLRSLVVAVLAFVVLAVPSVVLADGRVALVVGNSTYAHIGRLPNPDNDAQDISAPLRRLGFEVTTELDADRVELTEALRAFTRQSAGADVSLVFYAGHGIEMDGVNYLVPVAARLERDVDVRFETVTVDDLLVFAGIDVGRFAAAGGLGRLPEQSAGALDAAHGGVPQHQRRQLRRPERGPAGGRRDAGGVRRSGRDDSRGRAEAGTARTRRRCWPTWRRRWRSDCCFVAYGRRCWRRPTVPSVRTSTTCWWASTLPAQLSQSAGRSIQPLAAGTRTA